MEAVRVLKRLWQRRLIVAVGLVPALVVGTLMAYQVTLGVPPKFESRRYHVGIASAEVLVDSPNSQVIDLGGKAPHADVTSLSARAQLLGDLIATSPLKDRIALRAGVAPNELIAIRASATPYVEPSPLETGATVTTSDPRARILSVRVQEALPIIGADAQAPDPETAARISNATVAELQAYLKSAARADGVPDARKLVIEPLGPARSLAVTRGPRRLTSIAVALVLFVMWCIGVLVVGAFARSWKQVSEVDGGGETPRPNSPPTPAMAPAPSAGEVLSLPEPSRPRAHPEHRQELSRAGADPITEPSARVSASPAGDGRVGAPLPAANRRLSLTGRTLPRDVGVGPHDDADAACVPEARRVSGPSRSRITRLPTWTNLSVAGTRRTRRRAYAP